MILYNPMTCSNLSISLLGDCSLAWFSFAIVLFLALILRRQCDDGLLSGTGFNIYGAFALGLGANLVATFLTGSARWSLIAGVIGIGVGGYVLGLFMDTGGGGEE